MQAIDKIVNIKTTMERELQFIKEFNERYNHLRSAVQEKKWPELQNILKDCGRISRDVVVIEERRANISNELYAHFKLPLERNFFELVAFCPEDMRTSLKENYLELRAEVYRMKCRLKSLEAYSRVRMQLVEEVINKAQAIQSGGNPYKRQGKRAMHDPDSFLFDSVK
jgi:hypothetical protein